MRDNIDEFAQMVFSNHFVEAHEVLEEDWKRFKKEGKKEEAKFLQALINGATAIALWVKKRPEPSSRVWEFFQKNKHLIETVNLNKKEKYYFTIKLLEYKFSQKEKL
ncbi:MAG: DUF309 domain-containing protein [Arcobacteraceae bacterium]|nr:DUF309 domain-containing protein [Arcobacteraceae bacterium]